MSTEHQHFLRDLERVNVRPLDITYRYLHTAIAKRSSSEFSERVETTLNDIAQVGGTVVHLSTTTISHEVELLHVAHIVAKVPAR